MNGVSAEEVFRKQSSSTTDTERGVWSHKMDFILSCLSYAVGLGNVWRFPYLCYRNGGGAFLIPFLIMLVIIGLPIVFLEHSFGQYASRGIVSVWKVSPLFQGIGWAMFIVSVLISIYYNMIIAWTLYYLFASFASQLPWSYCGTWSTPFCFDKYHDLHNCTESNGTWHNLTCYTTQEHGPDVMSSVFILSNNGTIPSYKSPSDEYFHNEVLEISDGIHDLGSIKWQLVLCLILAWVIVCVSLVRGIKSSGKVVYFTSFFPYIVLTILLIRGLTLEGSMNGIMFYITPKWELLGHAKVWSDAAVQIFFSLSPCWGGLITLASFNKFKNDCLYDSILVSILDCLTSIFAGLVIFSIIGYMAHELKQPIDTVAQGGAGLAFVVYPEVVTKLPISQFWSILFFLMLVSLGLGTQIATVTTVHTTIKDKFPRMFRTPLKSLGLLLSLATVSLIAGLPFCTQGGMYVLQLFDNYAASYSLLIIGCVECLVLSWVYGAERMLTDIECMIGRRPHVIWAYFWKYIAPFTLMMVLIFTCIDFRRTSYSNVVFPIWADLLGVLITMSSVMLIPIVAAYKVFQQMKTTGMSFVESIKFLSKPHKKWGPLLEEHRRLRETYDLPEESHTELISQSNNNTNAVSIPSELLGNGVNILNGSPFSLTPSHV